MDRAWTIEAGRTAVCAATSFLTGLGEAAVAVGNAELGPFFGQLDDLSRQVEAGRVALLRQGLCRGVVAESDCPSATSWVIYWAPSYRAGVPASWSR